MCTNGINLRGLGAFLRHRKDIGMLSLGSKPVNGFGLRSPLLRDAPRYARISRFRYIACSENLLLSINADITRPMTASAAAPANTAHPETPPRKTIPPTH